MCFKKSNLKIDQVLGEKAQWVKDKKGCQSNLALTRKGDIGIGTDKPTAMLDVAGSVKAETMEVAKKVSAESFSGDGSELTGILPRGVIMMWSGTIENIPAGWGLCDGSKGTPDLVNKFVYGTDNSIEVGKSGGAESHSHTVDPHDHTVNPPSTATTGPSATIIVDNYKTNSDIRATHTHTHNVDIPSFSSSSSSPGTSPGRNIPPYLKLAFIMKL